MSIPYNNSRRRYSPMILDWNAHCYKIHTTHKLDRSDPSNNKSIFSQETHYVKYLLMKNLTGPQILEYWRRIKNGMAAVFSDDPELRISTFGRIYKAAQNIPEKDFNRHYVPVKIYKSEINFLNKVDAPIWVKQYWMTMLIYWKFASQHTKNVNIDTTLCNWAMRHTSLKDTRFGLYQDKIAQYNHLKSGYVMNTGIIKSRNCRNYWFDWSVEKSNEEFVEIKNLDNCKTALKLLSGTRPKCRLCGKTFDLSLRRHTDLCPECYAIERKKVINENAKKYYHSKKADIIDKNN